MRILILGAGKMGSFFTDVLSFDHDCAVYEVDPHRMRFLYHTQRFTSMEEIEEFQPELVINAVTLKYTLQVFNQVIPHLPKDCIISDISSVKTDFLKFYESTGMRYVSTHPMFGPTFANLGALSSENAIVIKEGDYMGIGDSSILSVGQERDEVVKDMVAQLVDEESSFICIYYGQEVLVEAANTLGAYLEETYPECEVEVQYGGQPIYYYVISVE